MDNYYEVVGTNSFNITDADINKLFKFEPDKSDRITIVADDLIGWYDGGDNIIAYDNYDPTIVQQSPIKGTLAKNLKIRML